MDIDAFENTKIKRLGLQATIKIQQKMPHLNNQLPHNAGIHVACI
jgi:hypothetical protein